MIPASSRQTFAGSSSPDVTICCFALSFMMVNDKAKQQDVPLGSE